MADVRTSPPLGYREPIGAWESSESVPSGGRRFRLSESNNGSHSSRSMRSSTKDLLVGEDRDGCELVSLKFAERQGEHVGFLQQLFLSPILSDMEFSVRGRQFYAHRIVIALCSRELEQLLTEGGDIDIDVEIFEDILRYIYGHHVEIAPESVFALLDCAAKFNLTKLVQKCARYLEENCSDLTTAERLFAVSINAPGCQSVVDRCAETILSKGIAPMSSRYLNLEHVTMVELLKSDRWPLHEDGIFDLVHNWCLHRDTDPRHQLSTFVPHLRFPQMTSDKLFQTWQNNLVPETILLESLFFQMGHYNVACLGRQNFRPRKCQIEFAQAEGFTTTKDRGTSKVRIRRVGTGGRCIRVSGSRSLPVTEVNFKIISGPRDIIFGFIEKDDKAKVAHESSGVMVGCYMQKRRHRGTFFSRPGGDRDNIDVDDTVRCRLDLERREFAYAVNNNPFEVAYADLDVKEYCFCFDMYTNGAEVEIL
eukprot:GEMP01006698.1.p1 GENE.GEMP01006698.1~~GEMP01006698.1.p1  ORF type:complete len:479 (+),score=98.84 GEMP01006698.1:70-1506(+)